MSEQHATDSRDARRKCWMAMAWIAVLGIAMLLDGPVAHAVAPWRNAVKHSVIAEEIREGGHVGVTVVAMLLLLALHPRKWRAVTLLAAGAMIASGFQEVIALLAGRIRPVVDIDPFAFFRSEISLNALFHAKNLSFPSGHATLAFVMAAALSHLLGRGHWLFFGGAALVGIERVAESAHYLSDVVAAAMLGVLAFRLTLRIHEYLWERFDRAQRYPQPSAVGTTVAQ